MLWPVWADVRSQTEVNLSERLLKINTHEFTHDW